MALRLSKKGIKSYDKNVNDNNDDDRDDDL